MQGVLEYKISRYGLCAFLVSGLPWGALQSADIESVSAVDEAAHTSTIWVDHSTSMVYII